MATLDTANREYIQESLEEVLDFKIQDEKLKFFIKWTNVSLDLIFYLTGSCKLMIQLYFNDSLITSVVLYQIPSLFCTEFFLNWIAFTGSFLFHQQPFEMNTWEDFETVKENAVFKSYIEGLWRSYAVDIEINTRNTRKKLSNQIMEKKTKQPGTCEEILKKNDFDEFQFKTLQLLYHFLMPQAEFERQFENLFVLNEVHKALKEQNDRFRVFAIQMQAINQFVTISFENSVDWKCIEPFKYIKSNIISHAIASFPLIKSSGCPCVFNCMNSGRCCATPYCVNGKSQIVLRHSEDENQTIIECGEACKCDKTCVNRYTQQNSSIHGFKVFKSEYGWGVKTEKAIPRGAFITECTGILVEKSTVSHNAKKSYFFSFKHNNKDYVINAHEAGNIAR